MVKVINLNPMCGFYMVANHKDIQYTSMDVYAIHVPHPINSD